MATSVKLGVDVSAFKAGIKDAQANVKALGAELKRNEAQFKATGNAEQYMTDKTRLLKMQMTAQKNEITNLENALKKMREAGVTPTSAAYQNMQRQLSDAQTSLLNMSVELNNVAVSEQNAAKGADQMANSLGSIGKKMSLQQVITGIDKISGAMEKAAKMAVNLGKSIWENITDSANWADNVATQATVMGVSVEDYQRLQGVFDTYADITVADWMNAKRKIQKAINDPSQDQIDVLAALGVSTHGKYNTGFGIVDGVARGWEDVFWEAAKRLQRMVENNPNSADLADTYGEALFGKKFSYLKPLIELGQEAFTEALAKQNITSDEAIENLTKLNDAYIDLQGDVKKLESELLAGMAPALTAATEAMDSLLGNLIEYLKSEDGQRLLANMGEVVSNMFADLSKIDPEDVVTKFTGVFNKVTGSLEWIVNNWQGVVDAMKGIVLGWGALRLTGGALQVLQLINGVKGLKTKDLSDAANAAANAAGGGAAAGGGIGTAIATWLTTTITNGVNWLGAGGLSSLPFIGDYLMNYTNAGLTLKNGGSVFDMFRTIGSDAQQWWSDTQGRAGTFLGDWLGVLENIFGGYGAKHSASNSSILGQPGDLMKSWDAWFGPAPVEIEPEVPEDAAEQISKHVGVVRIGVDLVPVSFSGGAGGGGGGRFGELQFHANGIWDVPWDGYPAILHQHERVVPAREVNNSRNFSSNLYVENMNMNGGTDAAGLAAAMAAAQRQTMRGYGS